MLLDSRRGGLSRLHTLLALVVIVFVFVGTLAYLDILNLEGQNISYSSQVSSYSSVVKSGFGAVNKTAALQAWVIHTSQIDAANVSGILEGYVPNATMIWTGNTQGLGGTYTGTSNIRFTYQTFLGGTTRFRLTVDSVNATIPSNATGTVDIAAVLNFTGTDAILGNFTGGLATSYVYVDSNGSWLISRENWNFVSFETEFATTDTTFPQWQETGPPVLNRYSESPFKNWVYFDGGIEAVMAILAYVAALPIIVYVRHVTRRRR